MNVISCIIIEDQIPAQEILRQYIEDTPSLQLRGVYVSAVDAFDTISQCHIDVMFLDLQLPKIDGFSFLRSLPSPPKTIVTTADPGPALEGYDLNVVDYLLKPFSYDRFLSAVSKLHETLSAAQKIRSDTVPEDIFIKSNGEINRIPIDQIEFIRADGDYVELFLENRKHHFLHSLKELEALLPNERFARVHKSYLINMGRITKIAGQEIIVANTSIPIGRRYKSSFLQKLGAKG